MRKPIAILACALALAVCRGKEPASTKPGKVTTKLIPEQVSGKKDVVIRPDVPNVLDKAMLGSALAADGTVAEETLQFKQGDPIALTIWFKQSPPGLNAGAIWYGAKDEAFERQKRPMNGEKVVTFALAKKLAPGKYRVEGYWGGNVVADKSFEVTGVSGGKKKP